MLEKLKAKRAMLDAQVDYNQHEIEKHLAEIAKLEEDNKYLNCKREIVDEMIAEEEPHVNEVESAPAQQNASHADNVVMPSGMGIIR